MPKGKKFSAAEKHFEEKRIRLSKDLNFYKNQCTILRKENDSLKKENQELQTENMKFKNWVERLLEYTELNKEDIKKACEKDRAMSDLTNMMNLFRIGY